MPLIPCRNALSAASLPFAASWALLEPSLPAPSDRCLSTFTISRAKHTHSAMIHPHTCNLSAVSVLRNRTQQNNNVTAMRHLSNVSPTFQNYTRRRTVGSCITCTSVTKQYTLTNYGCDISDCVDIAQAKLRPTTIPSLTHRRVRTHTHTHQRVAEGLTRSLLTLAHHTVTPSHTNTHKHTQTHTNTHRQTHVILRSL